MTPRWWEKSIFASYNCCASLKRFARWTFVKISYYTKGPEISALFVFFTLFFSFFKWSNKTSLTVRNLEYFFWEVVNRGLKAVFSRRYTFFAAPLESLIRTCFQSRQIFHVHPVIDRDHVVALLRINQSEVTAKKPFWWIQAGFFSLRELASRCFSPTQPATCHPNAIWDSARHASDY